MGNNSKQSTGTQRNVALCYIRQSFTRDATDKDSPERQRANILAYCEKMGWIPEIHQDADKHKTGTKEKNRPGWLEVKARLGDPDVVALVANDLARLHRKGWRVGDLIDYLDERDVTLVLTAPGREVDLSTPMGRIFVQFTAILDEWYAADISQRAKDSIAYRRAQGQSIGMPPFGTIRGEDGFLKPSPHGAWLLTSGAFQAGTKDKQPEIGATWKGYYDAAHFVLTHYALGKHGHEKIAYRFNEAGWAYRDRAGQPRPIERDDVRRIIANWAEYGGMVVERKAKDRPAYEQVDVDSLVFNEERAVFPIVLIKAVAKVRQERTMRRTDQSVKLKAYHYALSNLVYCAHCERIVEGQEQPKRRSLLSGNTSIEGVRRYRHRLGLLCGCINRSVPCEELDGEFRRLIDLLVVREDAYELMIELAIQADKARGILNTTPEELERERQEGIALCRKRIDAAAILFGDGLIDKEEYRRRLEYNEREIAHWQSRTSDTQKMALELAMCIEAVDKLHRLWDISEPEDRQGLARSLFTQLTYDLDTRRIVDFRLKPWAERFLMLRASLYDEDNGDKGGSGTGSTQNAQSESKQQGMIPSEIPYGAHAASPL